jgi:phage tail sheath protein FI
MLPVKENDMTIPGVYIKESSFPLPSVLSVPTSITAFIGYTENDTDNGGNSLNMKPTHISSPLEYELLFGGAPKETNLTATIVEHHDVKGQLISADVSAAMLGTPSTKYMMYYAVQMFFLNGGGECYIVSVDTYITGEGNVVAAQLQNGLNAIEPIGELSLIVYTDGLGVADATDYYALQNNAMAICATMQNRFALIDVYDSTGDTETNVANFINSIGADNLSYGAAYYPNLITTLSYAYDDNAVPLAISASGGDAQVLTSVNLGKLVLENNDVYNQVTLALKQVGVVVSPASIIAGVMTTVDDNLGVWKAPASVTLTGVASLLDNITDESVRNLNVDVSGKSINAIRSVTGKGIVVWGARTLDGNSNEFRYVPVRRFFIMVGQSLKNAIKQFVFEPNNANTWAKVQAMIENYFSNLWRLGALEGARPEDAYFVHIGLGQTMTVEDILNGRMIVEIGLATIRPAEFIIVSLSQMQQQS